MNVKFTKEMVDALGGPEKLQEFGLPEHHFRYGYKTFEVDLSDRSSTQVEGIVALVEPIKNIRGSGMLLKDCQQWLEALTGEKCKPRNVEQFHSFAILTLDKAPGHRVYIKDDLRDVWQAYYVESLEYHPPEKKNKWTTCPPYEVLTLSWTEFGGVRTTSIAFNGGDCVGITPDEALRRKGIIIENDTLRAEYERRKSLFEERVDKLGLQFKATGVATDDLDGNDERESARRHTWWWRNTSSIVLDKFGEPARVVIDVFKEGDEEDIDDRRRNGYVDRGFWARVRHETGEDDEEVAVDYDEVKQPEVPLHPMLACFDLRRHKRLRIDVGQLTPYIYDKALGEKLVLPQEEHDLIEMLLAHRGSWNDIVSGKSGGSTILCAGVPGTGKTLTAEVYAEVMERPLYSVQASQLGTSPDDLEIELLKVFSRAARWNAILLLDEADVYVGKRGTDLQQNAIVGVFLRVLEYYKGVLFLTTNRGDLVDDAIASRCIARIDYTAPTEANQKRIWRILSEVSGVPLEMGVIDQFVARNPKLTGRDVKNLLKLARLVSETKKQPITLQTLEFVKKFKPTKGNED